MTSQLKSMFAVLAFVLSFLAVQAVDPSVTQKTGVFGVCDCQSSSDKSKVVELSIKQDYTFEYIDNSDPNNKFILKGTWTEKGNRILLVSSDSRKSFHRKWKFAANEKCIKSRYMLSFKRICLANAC